jgi:hypothetical protein
MLVVDVGHGALVVASSMQKSGADLRFPATGYRLPATVFSA